MTKRWLSFYTMDEALKTGLSAYLKDSGINYELSGTINDYHFSINADSAEVEAINTWLDNN